MSDLTDRLAKLTPEQRTRLAERLAASGKTAAPRDTRAERRGWDNYGCTLASPGNFAGITFHRMERDAPGPGKIQIRAEAVSLNFRDLMIAMGRYPATPGVPSVMGSDYAGVVTACGEGVTDFEEGDRVVVLSAGSVGPDGMIIEDGHLCAVPNLEASLAARMPEGMSFEAAAGVPTVYLTNYYALCEVARLSPGERVLIHSATGGVGLSAIEIARWIGAEIYATAGSPEKREFLESIGIDRPMDSRTTAFGDQILDRTGGEGVDVVLNTLSGEGGTRGLEILRTFGRFLQLDKQDIFHGGTLALGPFQNALTYSAIDLSQFFKDPKRIGAVLSEIMDHMGQGHFGPVRTTAFPVDGLGDALTVMSRYQQIGKLVLTYD